MDSFDRFLQFQQDIAEATIEIVKRYQNQGKPDPKKRTSKTDTAWHVLKTAGCPLHVSTIMERALTDFQVQLDRDSIVSAMLKKAKAGKQFIKTAPNTFAAKD